MNNRDLKEVGRILAIDPGTRKAGFAILNPDGSMLNKFIIDDLAPFEHVIVEVIKEFNPEMIVLGDGTGSEDIRKRLNPIVKIPVEFIDESGSSEEARRNYLSRFSPLKRFLKIVGFIFGFVKFNLDDDVAVILGQRFLKEKASR